MPVCPKCGFPAATPLNCPACRSIFSKPLSLPSESPAKLAPSSAVTQEMRIDRRSQPRETPSTPGLSSKSATKPTVSSSTRRERSFDNWLQPPESASPAETEKSSLKLASETITPLPAPEKPSVSPISNDEGGLFSWDDEAHTPSQVNQQLAVSMQTKQPTKPPELKQEEDIASLFPPTESANSDSSPDNQSLEEVHAQSAFFAARLGSWLIDACLLGVFLLAILSIAQWIAGNIPPSQETGIDWVVDRLVAWKGLFVPSLALLAVFFFVYNTLFHALGGRTLGKRIWGLILVDSSGKSPNLATCALRAMLSLFSALMFMLGFAWIFFDRRRQSFHDKVTGTFVVKLL